jgi:hypothetical protein
MFCRLPGRGPWNLERQVEFACLRPLFSNRGLGKDVLAGFFRRASLDFEQELSPHGEIRRLAYPHP